MRQASAESALRLNLFASFFRYELSMNRLLVAFTLSFLGISPVIADDVAVSRRVTDTFVAPRVQALADAASAQAVSWKVVCTNPDATGVTRLKAAFAATASAWAAVEWLRQGPMAQNARVSRMAFWPDSKNAVTLGLEPLLASKQRAVDLRAGGVAVQGLSALERVLYGGSIDRTTAGLRRCAVGLAIAEAIHGTSVEIRDGWLKPGADLAAVLTQGKAAHVMLGRVAADLVGLHMAIVSRKLRDVMGDSVQSVRAERAEMVLSGRSLQQIAINLEAAAALTRLLVDDRGDAGANTISAADTAAKIAKALANTARLEQFAATPKGRKSLDLLIDAVQSAHEVSRDVIPATLGVTITVNALNSN